MSDIKLIKLFERRQGKKTKDEPILSDHFNKSLELCTLLLRLSNKDVLIECHGVNRHGSLIINIDNKENTTTVQINEDMHYYFKDKDVSFESLDIAIEYILDRIKP